MNYDHYLEQLQAQAYREQEDRICEFCDALLDDDEITMCTDCKEEE